MYACFAIFTINIFSMVFNSFILVCCFSLIKAVQAHCPFFSQIFKYFFALNNFFYVVIQLVGDNKDFLKPPMGKNEWDRYYQNQRCWKKLKGTLFSNNLPLKLNSNQHNSRIEQTINRKCVYFYTYRQNPENNVECMFLGQTNLKQKNIWLSISVRTCLFSAQ